jgi:hypothetical protein
MMAVLGLLPAFLAECSVEHDQPVMADELQSTTAMERNALRPQLAEDRGRDAHYCTPPAQIPASAIHALGSHLG